MNEQKDDAEEAVKLTRSALTAIEQEIEALSSGVEEDTEASEEKSDDSR